ncbi:MAG: hypothetical protein A2X34_01160 [Elusimicrobia bacterium GWC2_51_8]|nr:MAG: hypothetical protein A2X33_05350 [Elusimicrobia bacterium GWA2_51_34]OGR58666.1 MAG: hypothetical protein A2X34_01160 [Elusimicrobia bacterium GWC2_51_8]OGR86215.1 MAG: hypothetical protein A2021_05525 [Elusimicrobia bacterium GWF2_52_66]HAF96006.1 hypothetical protein [Elusimicrobiota bacterium]HCE96997.1 hypothetical protein [Elusimicrobiota bacterium]
MELSNDQQKALNILLDWYKDRDKTQFITLGGYAGTGKTTLMGEFRKEILKPVHHARIAFCSYTGRAAQNLKNKLKEAGSFSSRDSVSTIHGLIYTPMEDSKGRIIGWERKDELERDLIVVDEASMVDGLIWRDLLAYNIPIIAVGDHGQLPPISGSFNLMQMPDIVLTQIHRQARDNPIIKVSQCARKTGRVPPKEYGAGVTKYLWEDSDAQERSGRLLESYKPDTLILCGYNSTRGKINKFVRNSLGFESANPTRGDRVICLRNNHKKGICNGMLGTVLLLEPDRKDWYGAEIKMDDRDKPYSGLIYAPQFGAERGINFTKERKHSLTGDLFDFGYALTVHKAQGSQAKKVVMFEERFTRMDDEMWRRWLYTGVTRAEEELYLFGA